MVTTCIIEAAAQRPRTSARLLPHEAAGSLADLHAYIPTRVGLTQLVGLDAAAVVFAGPMPARDDVDSAR